MILDAEIENQVKEAVLTYLQKGRPGWDIPHTLACVYWMKKLIKSEGGNEKILIPAIYFHDIAYAELSEKEMTRKKIIDVKDEHMRRGALLAQEILSRIPGFSKEEIEAIAHLVRVHDNFDVLQSNDEQLVFEADSLGQIDRDRVKPTFTEEEAKYSLRRFEENRVPRFKTATGKRFLEQLLKKAKTYTG